MIKFVFLILFMTIVGAFASLLLKKSSQVETKGFAGRLIQPLVFLGFSLYFIASLANIYVLQFLPYSVVLPMTSITYVWTLLISRLVLKEFITRNKIIGIILVILGAVLVASS